MSKLLLSLAAVVAGVAGTAGAAVATEPTPQATATPVASPAVAVSAAPAAPAVPAKPQVKGKKAVAVVVVRTRSGVTGQSVFTLVGASTKQEAAILRLASTPAFQTVRPKYVVANTRGRYTYNMEVGFGDKTKKRVIVVEGAPGTPKVALDLIKMMTSLDVPDAAVNFPPGFPFN
ncbi:hypothetical protein [Actinoplanes sp. NPDC020271]|uniref:hypothetical protein n=1 Tax=Actinoplanes sp. NPDC020271 TaxID=3363896 RepID=UPI0037B5BC7E